MNPIDPAAAARSPPSGAALLLPGCTIPVAPVGPLIRPWRLARAIPGAMPTPAAGATCRRSRCRSRAWRSVPACATASRWSTAQSATNAASSVRSNSSSGRWCRGSRWWSCRRTSRRSTAPTCRRTMPCACRRPTGAPPGRGWRGRSGWRRCRPRPARFDAVRIEMSGNRLFLRGQMDDAIDPVWLRATAWYAPSARRVVRFTHDTWAVADQPLSRDRYELTSLKLV